MSEFELDWERQARTGVAEAILCLGKSTEQIDAIVAAAQAVNCRLLLTRLSAPVFNELSMAHQALLDYDEQSATAILGALAPDADPIFGIGIIAAGTSDMGIAREAARTLAFHGYAAPIVADVGVAGLWRLTRRIEEIRQFQFVIAIAGMEGALFSVLAGLVESPVIAVPSSVGYGVGAGGQAALNSALASCAPGLTVVNIDNGFGAASAAIKMARAAERLATAAKTKKSD